MALERGQIKGFAYRAFETIAAVVAADVTGHERDRVPANLTPPAEASAETAHSVTIGVDGDTQTPLAFIAHHQVLLGPLAATQLAPQARVEQPSLRQGDVQARDRTGFSTLHIGVLTANLPARVFYQAMGGREIGQRTFDEESIALPRTVYAWSDIPALAGGHGRH